ncbi:hypothetical protein BDR26DRAFT_862708 [Obelidium mucronatum]|nr:hypothetical protein BDR26DRAFT_862708 [Obelidium mucronatum]
MVVGDDEPMNRVATSSSSSSTSDMSAVPPTVSHEEMTHFIRTRSGSTTPRPSSSGSDRGNKVVLPPVRTQAHHPQGAVGVWNESTHSIPQNMGNSAVVARAAEHHQFPTPLNPLSPPIAAHDIPHLSSSSRDLKPLPIVPSSTLITEEEYKTREKKWKQKLNHVQGKLQQTEIECEKNKGVIGELVDLDRKPQQPCSQLSIVQSILAFCVDMGLTQTVEILQREAVSVLPVSRVESKRQTLQQYIGAHSFESAIYLVQEAMGQPSLQNRPDKMSLYESFEDLLYIFHKYFFLENYKRHDQATALHTLQTSYIYHHVQKECTKDARRGNWFQDDLKMLTELVQVTNSGYFLQSTGNMYIQWSWEQEIHNFWVNASGAHVPGVTPLYAQALNYAFPEVVPQAAAMLQSPQNVVGLVEAMGAHQFRLQFRRVIENGASTWTTHSSEFASADSSQSTQIQDRRGSTSSKTSNKSTKSANLSGDSSNGSRRKVSIDESMNSVQNFSGSEPSISVANLEDSQLKLRHNRPTTRPTALHEDVDKRSTASVSSSQASHSLPTELDKLMPPIPKEHETADFALSTTCGPVMGLIRALDVQPTISPTNQIIAATSGGEERNDRKISLWDVRAGTLISQLDNGTHKPVLALVFHPQNPDLLLTADMEFHVKLWDWKKGTIIRSWKKHHSRVIWKVVYVPGRGDFAASCSGDQSIKVWDTSEEKGTVSSVHANEPFTSFVFCGDVSEQTLIASLSYSMRIYKMRTMSLVHTIQLKDLKVNKTPVTSISSHPLYDNYILISCDHQIRLFDLSSETMLRVYTAREVNPGTRIEGAFSPCGTFVYSGSCDIRSLSSANRRASGILPTMHESATNSSNPNENISNRGSSPEAKGVYVWRVATGKLEISEMRAMESGSGSKRGPVTVCKWVNAKIEKHGKEMQQRKVLVAATLAGTVKLFL